MPRTRASKPSIARIEQPAYSPAQAEMASFFDDLANAFGSGDGGDRGEDDGDFPDLGDIFN